MRGVVLLILVSVCLFSCKPDKDLLDIDAAGYPHDIGRIILTKCAVSGCHNDASKDAAAGLSLASWEKMFLGADGEPVVVPYARKMSSLFLFINTHSELGAQAKPTMPANGEPLSYEEVLKIAEWIDNGALNNEGKEYFDNYGSREKYYVTNQGCDQLTVFDAKTDLVMRYVDLGNAPGFIESPHYVRVSPDKKFYYIAMLNGTVFQKYYVDNDRLAGQAEIGPGSWNTFALSPDGKKAFVTDFGSDRIAYVNTETMQRVVTYTGIQKPHGIAIDASGTKLLVTAQAGDKIYKIDISDVLGEDVSEVQINNPSGFSLPHEVVYTPDESKYIVSCLGTNEVKIFKTFNDSLLSTIQTGIFPQEIAVSTNGYAFITCTEDTVTFPGRRGSVSVIDYNSHTFIKALHTGPQPHGIVVNEKEGKVYIANRNVNLTGPAPHHSTECGGRNGTVTYIDLNNLTVIQGKKIEVSVDPYSIDVIK